MEKRFDSWAVFKKKLHKNSSPFCNEREIWWCSIGQNIGDEENGKNKKFLRPVLIIRKFKSHIFYAIPLSTQIKPKNRYYKKNLNCQN